MCSSDLFPSHDKVIWTCMALFAATLGFFVFNFPTGKIFLGDGGAYYLGFMLSAISVLTIVRHPEVSAWFCLAVVIYPIWEVVFSIYRRRKLSGKKATEPDKLERQVESMVQNHDVDFCYTNYLYWDVDKNKKTAVFAKKQPSGYIFNALLFRYRIGLLSVLIRKKAVIS